MRTFRSLLLVSAFAACAGASASAAETELRLSHWVPTQHALHPTGWIPWSESIHEASEGRISITIYPSQQLGNAVDHYDMARDGIADITYINPGYQPGRFPIVGLAEVPFMITNAKAGSRAFDEWYRPYAAEEMDDVHFCMAFLHTPGTFHSTQPIRVPDDLNGLAVRPAHATMSRFVSMLGGTSVQVPAPEVRELLSRGTAQAVTFPWDGVFLFGFEDAVPYHLDLPLYVTTFMMVMNKTSYEEMSSEDQAVIDEHCTSEWAEKLAYGWAQVEEDGIARMALEGHELYQPTEEETALWREAAEPLVDAWREDVAARCHDPETILNSFRDIMREHGSLVE